MNLHPEDAAVLVTAAHRAFALLMVGPEIARVDPPEAAHLVHMGLLSKREAARGYSIPGVDVDMDPFMLAVVMGSIMARESAEPGELRKAWTEVTKMRGESLKRWVDRVNLRLRIRTITGKPSIITRHTAPEHLSTEEAAAWLSARTRAGVHITAIGERARQDVRAMTRQAIEDGINWKQFAARLNAKYGAWTRDWERVARTELQGAYNEGVVAAAVAHGGMEQRIARVPEKDACEHCKRLFLVGGVPRIFTVRELVNNGTNVGKKPENWQATVWPIHPNCRCDSVMVPSGHGFDDSWNLTPVAS